MEGKEFASDGKCVCCGYHFYSTMEILPLGKVNELRKELEMQELTELAVPTQAWRFSGREPK